MDPTLIENTSKQVKISMSSLSIPEALRLIPEFNGDKNQLHHFINACETVLVLIAEENKTNFFKILKLKLKDKAYDIVKYDNIKNFAELKVKLMTQFLETRTLEVIQVELVTIKQKYNENESDYANRVERLLSDLNTACIPMETAEDISKPIRELNSRTALRAFQEGLREPLKLLVKASRYGTLKQAVEAAITEGKQYPLQEQKQRSVSHNSPAIISKFCTHCRKNGHSYDECRSKLKCARCQRIGHSVAQCRVNTNLVSSPKAQITVITCHYCKKPGHVIAQCRKREYNNKRANSGNQNSPAVPRAAVAALETEIAAPQ